MPNKETFKGNFKSIIDVGALLADEGKLPREIQVLPHGTFNTQRYGPLALDEGIFDQMVANFNAKVRRAVPVDVDHDGGQAAGWIERLENRGSQGLFASVSWTKIGKELLSEKIYKLFSPEWSFDYTDPQHSTHHGAVLIAGSLTNRPLFKNLEALVASEESEESLTNDSGVAIILLNDETSSKSNESKNMKLKDILAKSPSERSKEELEFLKAQSAKLNDAQKAQLKKESKAASEEEAGDESDEEREAREAEEAQKAKDAEEAEAAQKAKEEETRKANEGKEVTIEANEHAELLKAKEELDSMRAREAVEKTIRPLIANSEGGKILPKAEKEVVQFLLTCSEEQKQAFVSLMESMPEVKVAGQESDSEGEASMSADEQLERQAQELMKADESLSHYEALKRVNKDPKNKELVNQ